MKKISFHFTKIAFILFFLYDSYSKLEFLQMFPLSLVFHVLYGIYSTNISLKSNIDHLWLYRDSYAH